MASITHEMELAIFLCCHSKLAGGVSFRLL